MKIAVVGLGAIGGLFAARLARAGHHVSGLARGETLARVRANGLILEDGAERYAAEIVASDEPEELGAQDLVVIAVKGPSLPALAPSLGPLLGEHTAVLSAMNGVPWWLLPSAMPDEAPLRTVDPDGATIRALSVDRVLGGVVHLSSRVVEPGVIHHNSGDHLIIGEARGGETERAGAVCQAFRSAGFQVDLSANVRRSVWYKLWGNMTMNPLSVVTGGTTAQILDDELVRAFVARVMIEASAIGARIGCPIEQQPEDRMQVTRKLGGVKTSMLEDALAGRAIELDPIVGAVREIGERLGMPTPNIDTLLGITRLNARLRNLY